MTLNNMAALTYYAGIICQCYK